MKVEFSRTDERSRASIINRGVDQVGGSMLPAWPRPGQIGLRANAVCPGFIDTPILAPTPDKIIKEMEQKVPLRRLGKPEKIANSYAFLASDEASYISGAVIEVNGG
jgi:3-oxoacyl-[acyl-carrier protein] reductase